MASRTLKLDLHVKKEKSFEIAQKFMKWRRVQGKLRSRKYLYLRKYNTTEAEVRRLKEQQDFKCSICRKELESGKKTHVDHNHYTGKVRGILCSNCNLGLGNFKDSISSLERAVEYLKENDEN